MLLDERPNQQQFMGTTRSHDISESFSDKAIFSVAWLGSKQKKTGEIHYVIFHPLYNDDGEVEAQWVGGFKAQITTSNSNGGGRRNNNDNGDTNQPRRSPKRRGGGERGKRGRGNVIKREHGTDDTWFTAPFQYKDHKWNNKWIDAKKTYYNRRKKVLVKHEKN